MMSNSYMHFRFFTFFLLLLLLALYTYFKIRQFFPGQRLTPWILTVFIVVLSWGWIFLYQSKPAYIEFSWFGKLCWAGSICMGIWACFLLLSIPLDFGIILVSLGQKLFSTHQPDPLRRILLTRSMSLIALGTSGGIGILGFRTALSGPKVAHVAIPIQELPTELVGLRIVQISDLHIGTTIQRESVEDLVKQITKLKPDLIAVTGDFADGTPEVLAKYLEPFSTLYAPLGIYYVTGNHEYYWGAEGWIQKARDLGFIPLMNENRILDIKGVKVLIAGVTDTSSHDFFPSQKSDPHRAAQINTSHSSQLKVLLAHRPNSCFEAEPAGFHLQLSGHTHGGQFFPWSLLIPFVHRYYRGLNRHGGMWVYVNSGTGYWGPPNRFQIPSEITLIELVRA